MWKIRRFFKRETASQLSRSQIKIKAMEALGNKYDFISVIGRGSFGDIIALWSKQKKKTVAAKVVDPQMTSKSELKLWPRLKHRNIVPVFKLKRRPNVVIFLMPHYSKTLMEVLEEDSYRNDRESFVMATEWMTDILSGLEYLHNSNICHLDLKTDNIMITDQNTAVIGDFSSIDFAKGLTHGYALPTYYCPPEAWPLNIYAPHPKVDGKAFDIWSYGMLILYIFTDKWMEIYLFGQTDWWIDIYPLISKCLEPDLYYHLLCYAFPYNCPKRDSATVSDTWNLITGVLRFLPEDRPTPTRILQHPILSKKEKRLLEADIIWTCDKEDLQKIVLKDKVHKIIKTAFLTPGINEEMEEIYKNKKNLKKEMEGINEVPVPTVLEYFCSCCYSKQEEKK